MNDPEISIIMPLRNASKYLNECLDSIINQSEKNWELNIVNDHSTDNSALILESYIEKGYPIYGVTTGFGDSCHKQISPQKTEKLQEALVNFHGIGVGDFFTREESRAITLVRLNSNVKGYSAITVELANLILELIIHDIVPVIPQIGSVGA